MATFCKTPVKFLKYDKLWSWNEILKNTTFDGKSLRILSYI